MGFREHDRKTFVADSARAFRERRITKREFMRRMALAGVGFSGFASTFLGNGRPFGGLTNVGSEVAAAQTPDDVRKWLKDVGGKFKGTTIRYTSEATPPTIVANQIAKDEFTAVTGINVEIEIVPLEQVLEKATLDVQGQLGTYDLYYLDQSWTGMFANDCVDPVELYKSKPELAMPGYDWDDFSKPLVDGISRFQGRLMGVPFDIPIFILMYRKDLYDKHGIKVPTTMAEYMAAVKAIDAAERKNGIYGTTGQLKSGHYSLNCDWTCWVWAHGGSVFDKSGMFSGADAQGMKGLAYMLELMKYMPPAAVTWTWDGEGQSVTQGVAAQLLSWGEFFPGFDGKDSKVVGVMEAAPPPKEDKLRTPEEAGFGEIPHIGHQGGSSISLSKYSKNPDAAWIFMQWVTSPDVVARSCTLGGGASPVRSSAFKDPRVLEAAKVGPGTTRHFPAIEATINNAMGTEPHAIPAWVEISNNIIPVELGKLFAGQYRSPEECMAAIKQKADEAAAPFRKA